MYVAELDLVSADGGDCYAVLFDLFFETALLVLKSTVVLPAVVCFFEPVRSYLYAVFLVVVVAAGAAAVAAAAAVYADVAVALVVRVSQGGNNDRPRWSVPRASGVQEPHQERRGSGRARFGCNPPLFLLECDRTTKRPPNLMARQRKTHLIWASPRILL